jgi:hypothetical protein
MIFQTLQILLLVWFDLEEDWDYITSILSMLVTHGKSLELQKENWFNNARFADDQIAGI